MSFLVADGAYGVVTGWTDTNLPPLFEAHVFRLDPFSTAFTRTIDSILGSVLFELAIPRLLEILAKQFINMLEIDVVFGATPWRHMRRVFDRHFEDTP